MQSVGIAFCLDPVTKVLGWGKRSHHVISAAVQIICYVVKWLKLLRDDLKKALCNSGVELHHQCLWQPFQMPQEVQTFLLLLSRHEMMREDEGK